MKSRVQHVRIRVSHSTRYVVVYVIVVDIIVVSVGIVDYVIIPRGAVCGFV